MDDSFAGSHPIAMRVGRRRMSIPRRRSRASDASTSPSTSPESTRDGAPIHHPMPNPTDSDDYPRPRAAAAAPATSPPAVPGAEPTMDQAPEKTEEQDKEQQRENRRQRREREHGHGKETNPEESMNRGYVQGEHQQGWYGKGGAHMKGVGGARIVQPEGKGFM
ncbi:hypothetical protein A4X09_0g5702 [Tilletia walkeri]|uniref:Uncharacterized protein n=1 Tax=Tilletia walkeri TaxID=117179 RepID=A0A8X7N6M7_9BASI|nr:hypothetical protein A4X09_0g5702 [Tilletia walkeri]